MSKQQIYTKLHEAQLTARNGRDIRPFDKRLDHVNTLLNALETFPHYVLNVDLARNIKLKPLRDSMSALFNAGVMQIPFPEVALELWGEESDRRLLAYVTHGERFGDFECEFVEWSVYKNESRVSVPIRARFRWEIGMTEESAKAKGIQEIGRESPEAVDGWSALYTSGDKKMDENMEQGMGQACYDISVGLMLLIMMVNIAGLEREVIDTTRINKARAQSSLKKPKIHTHTVVRIGHVYDKSGHRVSVPSGAATGRGKVAVHMRAAHTRRQIHGPGFLETLEGKQYAGLPTTTDTHHVILIDAVLVNYKDGTDLEKPLPKIVRM